MDCRILYTVILALLDVTFAGNCRHAEAPANGYTTREPGSDELVYHCRRGYQLIGRKYNYCLISGDWAHSPLPVCQALVCPPLLDVQYGVFHPSQMREHGTVVHYSCEWGTKIVGSDTIQCDEGTWRPQPPTCYIPSCEDIDLDHRKLVLEYGSTEVGGIMNFRCTSPDHEMFGDPFISCEETEDGNLHYDKVIPYCAEPGVGYHSPLCEHLTMPASTAAILQKDSYCYKFITRKDGYYDALKECKKESGVLVTIPDREVNDWLVDQMNRLNWGNTKVWIGLKHQSGEWQWNTLHGARKLSWYSSEKVDDDSGYCQSLETRTELWKNEYCKYFGAPDLKYVCQYEQ